MCFNKIDLYGLSSTGIHPKVKKVIKRMFLGVQLLDQLDENIRVIRLGLQNNLEFSINALANKTDLVLRQ